MLIVKAPSCVEVMHDCHFTLHNPVYMSTYIYTHLCELRLVIFTMRKHRTFVQLSCLNVDSLVHKVLYSQSSPTLTMGLVIANLHNGTGHRQPSQWDWSSPTLTMGLVIANPHNGTGHCQPSQWDWSSPTLTMRLVIANPHNETGHHQLSQWDWSLPTLTMRLVITNPHNGTGHHQPSQYISPHTLSSMVFSVQKLSFVTYLTASVLDIFI